MAENKTGKEIIVEWANSLPDDIVIWSMEQDADLYKVPGVSETLDWTSALIALNTKQLDLEIVDDTLGVILKYQDDIEKVVGDTSRKILEQVHSRV